MQSQNEKLADDILYGAEAIADYTGLTVRQVYHQQDNLGLGRLGGTLTGSKRKLRERLAGEAA